MTDPRDEHVRHHQTPRITANDLARYMVASETGKIGIIRRAETSVTATRVRYGQIREPLRAHLSDPSRNKKSIHATRAMLEQISEDPSRKDFPREDAKLSIDALDAFVRMQNKLGGYDFAPAPKRQAKLVLAGVDVSVAVDLLVMRSRGSEEQIGGALFRFTKADEETDAAASKRREIGIYAATLVQMHVRQHLAGNRLPHPSLCLSIDVQCEEVHVAPRNFTTKAQNLENACRFIAAMWGRV